MKKVWIWVSVILMSVASLLPVAKVSAATNPSQNDPGDEVVFGEQYHLGDGESVNHGLVLVGCNAVIGKDARVNGDVTVAGGNLDLQKGSSVNGNVVLVGGTLNANGATINGDMGGTGAVLNLTGGTKINGTVYLGPGCTLEGDDYSASEVLRTSKLPFKFDKRYRFSWGGLPLHPTTSATNGPVILGLLIGLYKFLIAMFLMLLLAVALVAIWPREMGRMGDTALTEIVPSFAIGFAALLLGFPVGIVLVVLLITLPFGLLLFLLLFAAMAVGWVAVALKAGEKLLLSFKVESPTPVLSVIVGGALLILLGKVPCVGWMITLVVVMLGTGAVALTRFGTREYEPHHASRPPRALPEAVGGGGPVAPPPTGGHEGNAPGGPGDAT